MAAFELEHLGRNVFPVGAAERVVITNISDRPAQVLVHIKQGSAWHPFGEPVLLAPGACWSARAAELGGGMVLVLARGQDGGRNIVRVEY